jgi:8-oxo-dGTP pyrophosphatase MutT (NUDIX family)
MPPSACPLCLTQKRRRMSAPASNGPIAHTAQVAALPLTIGDDGSARVLLVTSRDSKRWVIPKGWPMKGRSARDAAAQEALEEAGIVGRTSDNPIGTYLYLKRRDRQVAVCRVDVYVLVVEKQLKNWPEKGQRRALWLTPQEAAGLVDEPGLIGILRSFA